MYSIQLNILLSERLRRPSYCVSIALIRDICTAPVNIYTITTNCSNPKKQNSKKKKKAFTFLLSFISLTNTILFPKIVRWPRSKMTFSLVPKESFGIIYSWAHHLFHMQNYYTLLTGTV